MIDTTYLNVVVILMVLSFGMLVGYWFADESWRTKRKGDFKILYNEIKTLQWENQRLSDLNDGLIHRLKEKE
tara:strand:- start:148 stop:363 length:216 start_codon:yes stop_codon:yes gene_type:complete